MKIEHPLPKDRRRPVNWWVRETRHHLVPEHSRRPIANWWAIAVIFGVAVFINIAWKPTNDLVSAIDSFIYRIVGL